MKTMQDLYNDYPNMIPDFNPENEIAALLTPEPMPDYEQGVYSTLSVETWSQTLLKYAHLNGASVQFIATDKDEPCGQFVCVLMLEPGSEAHYNFVNNIEQARQMKSDFIKTLNEKIEKQGGFK